MAGATIESGLYCAGRAKEIALSSEAFQAQPVSWLLEHGPRELELLFRAIVFHPSFPVSTSEYNYPHASAGGQLFGLSGETPVDRKTNGSELGRVFPAHRDHDRELQLTAADGS